MTPRTVASPETTPARSRPRYAAAGLAVLVLGLAATRPHRVLPPELASDAGDALWALLFVYLLFVVLAPRARRRRVYAAAELPFSAAIEFSQLYHALWIDRIRHTLVGGLILGYTFAWGDLLCYLAGATAGLLLDRLLWPVNDRRGSRPPYS